MVLTLDLGTAVQGDKLAQIVEASMKEIEGWQFEARKNIDILDIYAWYYNEAYAPPPILFSDENNLSPEESILYAYFKDSELQNVAYFLRKSGEGKLSLFDLDFFHSLFCIPITFGLLAPSVARHLQVKNKTKERTNFLVDDTIFTFIDLNQKYSELDFYANAAFDITNHLNGGVVEREDSLQFRKIQPPFDKLVGKMKNRLPQNYSYRSQALNYKFR